MSLLKLHRIGNEGIQEENHLPGEPYVLVLGGLLHFNGQQLGAGFCKTINSLTQKSGNMPVYTLTAPELKFGTIVDDLCAFSDPKLRTVGDIAREITNRFILPDSVLEELHGLNQHEAVQKLTDHMSCINLVGYCYGSGLIQQIEIAAFEKLKAFTRDHGDFALEGLVHSFSNVWGVNIAPSATPSILNRNNALIPGDIKDPAFPNQGALFHQFFGVRHYDKICQDLSGDAFRQPYSLSFMRANQSSVIIGDKTGDSFIRRAGLSKNANGYAMPRLDYSLDHEGHSLLLYANTLDVSDGMITFPSSGVSRAIHQAMYQMCSRSISKYNLKDEFNAACFIDYQQQEKKRRISSQLRTLQREFGSIVKRFVKLDLQGSRSLLQSEIENYSGYQGEFSHADIAGCHP